MLLKFNPNRIRVPKNDFTRQKCRTRRDNPYSNNPSWKARKKPFKGHTKNRSFFSCKNSKDRICHMLYSRVGSPEKNGFDSYGSSLIVDNSENDNICSEEYMFTEKIDPIIYNGVATIGVKYLITKWTVTVIWSWTDDEGQLQTKKLNTVLYFPDSSVNVLSEIHWLNP